MKVILSATFYNTTQQWPISVTVLIDNDIVWAKSVITKEVMQIEIDNSVAKHQVKITFGGKTNVETDIAADTAIVIEDISVQGIGVDSVLQKIATYCHYTNGNSQEIIAEYTNFIGFDGCIEFNLDTPISNWFYKNYAW